MAPALRHAADRDWLHTPDAGIGNPPRGLIGWFNRGHPHFRHASEDFPGYCRGSQQLAICPQSSSNTHPIWARESFFLINGFHGWVSFLPSFFPSRQASPFRTGKDSRDGGTVLGFCGLSVAVRCTGVQWKQGRDTPGWPVK